MAYATQQDIIDRGVTEAELLQLVDDENSGNLAGANPQLRVNAALDEASARIDSYCRQRYTVPLQSSAIVKATAVTIAIKELFARRRRVPDDVKERYDEAIKFLMDVSKGNASLDQPTGATAQTGSGGVKTTDVAEKFSDENLDGYV